MFFDIAAQILGVATPIAAFASLALALAVRKETRGFAVTVDRLRADVSGLQKGNGESEPAPTAGAEPEAGRQPNVGPDRHAALELPPAASIGEPDPAPAVSPAAWGRQDIERKVLGSWAVWLGAVALALGGAFLVKYSIENDLLGPATRVMLGLCLGLALIASGEFFHRHPPLHQRLALGEYATALIAAGLATLFSSLYAAHALYDFINGAIAFVLLSVLSGTAIALSLRHGPLIAAVGILGAFLVPALVKSAEPAPWTLFGYLTLLVGSCAALVRQKAWWWLGWLALAGICSWAILWLATVPPDINTVPFTAFLVLSPAALFQLRDVDSTERNGLPVVWTATCVIPLFMILQLIATKYETDTLIGAFGLVTVYLYNAFRNQNFDRASWIAAVTSFLAIVGWNVRLYIPGAGHIDPLNPPPAFPPMATTAALLAALISLSSFWALWRTSRPQRWAAASAATPVFLLTALYLRRSDALPEMPWATIGLAIAALEVWAAFVVARQRSEPGKEEALAFYAVAAIAAVSLSATMSVERAWLTVALAVEVPAIAWVSERTNVTVLRPVALVIAGAVGLRLIINHDLYTAVGGPDLLFNWVLYTYGIPAVAFAVSAHWFRGVRDDQLVMTLEAGAIAAGFLLLVLEIRHAFTVGGLLLQPFGEEEVAVQVNAWLIATLILFKLRATLGRLVYFISSRTAAWAALAMLLLGPIIGTNPLFFSSTHVGDTPLLNLLVPLYGLPAILTLCIFIAVRRAAEQELACGFGAMTLLLGFLYLSLNIRQLFHGDELRYGTLEDAESYAYSAAWLCYGGLLLLTGILRVNRMVRFAGLAILALAVGKTFLYDMSALTGLYRSASFLGLGAALIGLGYLYQRLVRSPT